MKYTYIKDEMNNINISIRDNKIVSITAGWDWRINPKFYDDILSTESIKLLLQNPYRCSMCNCIIDKENHFYHYDFRFCDKCAKEYKKMHSRKCKICGKPEWECVC